MEPIITYYSNGKVNKQYFKLNGKKEGEYLSYHDNGQLCEKCNYINNKKEGEYLQYYDDGHFSDPQSGSEKYGLSQDKPQFKIKCNYVNNKIEGEYLLYDELGHIISITQYHNDNVITKKYFDHNGNIMIPYEIIKSNYVFDKLCQYTDEICTICRCDKKIELLKLDCSHIYHKQCLINWFDCTHQEKIQLCPLCKHEIEWVKCCKFDV